MKNLTTCNNCAGKIIRSLQEHITENGIDFCSEYCAEYFFSDENKDKSPTGLAYDLGVE